MWRPTRTCPGLFVHFYLNAATKYFKNMELMFTNWHLSFIPLSFLTLLNEILNSFRSDCYYCIYLNNISFSYVSFFCKAALWWWEVLKRVIQVNLTWSRLNSCYRWMDRNYSNNTVQLQRFAKHSLKTMDSGSAVLKAWNH